MNKQNVVYPYNEILCINKKQQATDSCYNMDEPLKKILLSKRTPESLSSVQFSHSVMSNSLYILHYSTNTKSPEKANL